VKVVIAGGREYTFTQDDKAILNKLHSKFRFTEVVSGGARGADHEGELWAKAHNISLKIFPADWDTHGKSAGYIRNRQMAEYADAVILMPGGKGTASMHKEADRMKLQILYDDN
jgi:hypothetical protein